jgi:hypothetical protein
MNHGGENIINKPGMNAMFGKPESAGTSRFSTYNQRVFHRSGKGNAKRIPIEANQVNWK